MVGRGGQWQWQWQWQPESAAAAARPGRGGVVYDGAAAVAAAARVQAPAAAAHPAAGRQRPWLALVSSARPVPGHSFACMHRPYLLNLMVLMMPADLLGHRPERDDAERAAPPPVTCSSPCGLP